MVSGPWITARTDARHENGNNPWHPVGSLGESQLQIHGHRQQQSSCIFELRLVAANRLGCCRRTADCLFGSKNFEVFPTIHLSRMGNQNDPVRNECIPTRSVGPHI